MEENFNKKPEPSVQKPKKQGAGTETKKKKAKAAVIALSTIVVLFLGLQVYASTNGYGNVFFMIKNLITTGNPAGNQEIFSDKDITLSYKSIDLAEGLKIQANRLEIKDGKTKIFLSVKSQDAEPLPLKYETITNSNDGKSTTTKINTTGQKPEETEYIYYEDIIELSYEVKESDTIVLKISDSKDKELRTLEINLETREITVRGEKDFEKISQIELKKYLSLFSELNNGTNESDVLVAMAETLIDVGGEYEGYGIVSYEDYKEALNNNTRMEIENQIIKEIYGDKAKFETIKTSKGQEVEVLKGISNYQLKSNVSWMDSIKNEEEQYFSTTDMADYKHGECLKIEDASYENNIYTIKYVYTLVGANDENLEDLPQYETTIKLKRKEDNKYSKYEIVSLEKGVEIKNKVDTNASDDSVNKQSSSGTWYTIDLYPNNELKLRFTNDDFDKLMGNINIDKTKGYPITGINGKVKKIYQSNNGTSVDPMIFFLLEDGTIQYMFPIQQIMNDMPTSFKIDGTIDEVKNAVEIKSNKNDVVIAVLKNGQEVKIWNQFMEDFFGNETETTTTNEQASPDGWKAFNTLNNATIKLPANFVPLDEKYNYERYKTQYFEGAYFEGKIKVKYDVTLSSNMYPGSETAKSYLGNNEERMVESKDNNGWTNWYPISDASRILNNGFERKYGRVGNGQFEEITFTYYGITGCDLPQYKFMSDVMSSVNSKGIQ